MFGFSSFSEVPFSTLPSAASTGITGTLAITLDDVVYASSAVVGHSGTLAVTLDGIVFAASASTGAVINGSMAITLDSVVYASSATLGHVGTLSATLADIDATFSGTTGHPGTLSATLADISATFSGNVNHPATLTAVLDGIAFSSNATVSPAGSITATMAITLEGIAFAASGNVVPQLIFIDTHDGDKGKKRFEKEVEDKKRKRQKIIDAYEDLVEARPQVVEKIVAPYINKKISIGKPIVDFDALISDINRVEMLLNEIQELDDEEVLLLI